MRQQLRERWAVLGALLCCFGLSRASHDGPSGGRFGALENDATRVMAALDASTASLRPLGGALPRARAYHAAALVGSKVFIFGGVAAEADGATAATSTLLNDLHFYDVERQQWSGELARVSCCVDGVEVDLLDPRPEPRAYAGAAAVGSRLYVFGGLATSRGRDEAGVAFVDDYSLARGSVAGRALDDVHFFDEASATWSGALQATGERPGARFAAAVASYREVLVVFGGVDAAGRARNDLSLFNTTSHRWSAPSSDDAASPSARGYAPFAGSYYAEAVDARATASDHRLFLHGGATAPLDSELSLNGTCEACDASLALDDTWALDPAALCSTFPSTRWERVSSGGGRGRAGHALVVARYSQATGSVLYATGGLDGALQTPVDAHAALDARGYARRTAAWRDVSREADPRPAPRVGATVTPYDQGQTLFHFGGFEYDAATNRRRPTADFTISTRLVLPNEPVYPYVRTVSVDPDSGVVVYQVVS